MIEQLLDTISERVDNATLGKLDAAWVKIGLRVIGVVSPLLGAWYFFSDFGGKLFYATVNWPEIGLIACFILVPLTSFIYYYRRKFRRFKTKLENHDAQWRDVGITPEWSAELEVQKKAIKEEARQAGFELDGEDGHLLSVFKAWGLNFLRPWPRSGQSAQRVAVVLILDVAVVGSIYWSERLYQSAIAEADASIRAYAEPGIEGS
jgi:hypothetical protein